MERVFCKSCSLRRAEVCCICDFPIRSYCASCFDKHCLEPQYGPVFHQKLDLAARSTIDSRDKQKQVIDDLMELGEYYRSTKDISERLEGVKQMFGEYFDRLIWLLRQHQRKITTKIDEMNLQAATTLEASIARISAYPLAAGEELCAVSSSLAAIYSSLDEIQNCLENCSAETAARAVETRMAITFPEYQQFERVVNKDLVLCLPSKLALGVFTFSEKTTVGEVCRKVEEVKGLARFNLSFGDVQMKVDKTLGDYNLPHLAVVEIWPYISFISALLSEEVYITDLDTVRTLREIWIRQGRGVSEHHHFLCDSQVLDDDFLLINAGGNSIFSLFQAERPWEALLIRDDSSQIFELPMIDPEELVFSLKQRIGEMIRYDEECQRLNYCLRELSDDSSLSSEGIQGGNVIDLERLVNVLVVIPAIGTPFCITEAKKQATVLMIKLEIARRLSLPPDHQQLYLRNQELQDDELLCSDFRSTVTVTLIMKEYLLAMFHTNDYVAVEFLGGEEISYQLKLRVTYKLNLEPDSCELVYNGSRLNSIATLASAGVTEGCLVIVFQPGSEEGANLDIGRPPLAKLVDHAVKFGMDELKQIKMTSNEPHFLSNEEGNSVIYPDLESLNARKTLKVTVKHSGQDLVLQQLDPSTRIIAIKELLRLKLTVPVEFQTLINGLRKAEDSMRLSEFSTSGESGIVFRLRVDKS